MSLTLEAPRKEFIGQRKSVGVEKNAAPNMSRTWDSDPWYMRVKETGAI